MPRKAKSTHDVSIHGDLYSVLQDYCRKKEVPIGAEVSTMIDDHFDLLELQPPEPEPQPEPVEPREPSLSDVEIEAEARKHFTF